MKAFENNDIHALGNSGDTFVSKTAAGEVSAGTSAYANDGTFVATIFRILGSFGGKLELKMLSEEITLAVAANTDSTANLLPAGALILGVALRVTAAIPTAASFTYGDATTAARFGTGILVAAGTTDTSVIAFNTANTNAAGPVQGSAAKIRITPNLQPATATGKVRVTVFYLALTAPTS